MARFQLDHTTAVVPLDTSCVITPNPRSSKPTLKFDCVLEMANDCLVHISGTAIFILVCMQDLTAQYEEQLSTAKAAAANAAESSEAEKSAATAARTAATAASEREALLKQNLHDAEERSAATSSQLGATQQRVSLLIFGCALLFDCCYLLVLRYSTLT